MKKISKWIVEHSKLIVILSILLLIPATIGYIKTKVNYDILVYLPDNIETMKGSEILTNDLGSGAFAFVMTSDKDERKLLELEDKINNISSVNKTLSIANLTKEGIPLSFIPDEILDKVYKNDKTLILVTFKGGTSEESTLNGIRELRNIANNPNDVQSMSGMVVDTMDLSEKEVLAYVILAVTLSIIVLLISTDSYLIPIFLLGNIGFAILYNLGSNIFLGEISYITKAISAVLQLGVTMDFSIFLYHKYEELKQNKKYKTNKEAMAASIEETYKSVVGSSLTTIAGFLSLIAMELTLGKDIGIVMAKGVVLGLVCVIFLLPSLLLIFDKYINKTKHKVLLPTFKKVSKFSVKHYILSLIVLLILIIPSIYGNKNVNVYYKLDKSLPSYLPSRVSSDTLQKDFNIVSPTFILLDKNLSDDKVIELSNKLKELDGIDMVLTTKDIGIPTSMLPDELLSNIETDKYQIMIINSTYEVASTELNNQLETINNISKEYDSNSIVAGEGALTKDLVKIADHDFKSVNYISIAIIFIIMLFVLKSISLPFILVLIIELAIFANMSISYYTGVTIPFIASIVIGTIQLGATIDYAILMSNTYLNERKKNKDKKGSMQITLEKTIPSIVLSALCFFASTYGVRAYSKIDMISSLCGLLSRGAIISMFTVVLFLPSLLLILDKLIMKTTKDMKGSI